MNQCLVGLGKFPEQTGTVTQPAFVFGLDTVCVHAEFHLAQVYDPVSPLYYHVYLSAGHSSLLGLTCHVDKDVAMPLIPKADLICL